MVRQPGSLSFAHLARGVSMTALLSFGCAGTGPAIVEHPRSSGIVVVSPETDVLAGTPVLRPGESDPPRAIASAPWRARTFFLRERGELVTPGSGRVVIVAGPY